MVLRPREKEKKNHLSILAVLLLLAAAGFFLSFAMAPHPKKSPASVSAYSPQAEALVNKHLFLTSQYQYLRGKKTAAQNSYMAPQLGDSIWPKISAKKEMGIDHSPDSNERNAYDDLNRYRKDLHYTNPDQVIQGEMVDEDLQDKANGEARLAYVQQFLDNARRNGFIVKLDENFVVVNVTKAPDRLPNSAPLFDSSLGPVPSGGAAQ